MLDATLRHLERHGVTERPEVLLADAGYFHTAQMQAIEDRGIEVLAPPDGNMREGTCPGWDHGRYQQVRDKLTSERGRELYAQRKITIEPVFGQIKHNRHVDPLITHFPTAARRLGRPRRARRTDRDGPWVPNRKLPGWSASRCSQRHAPRDDHDRNG